jgi:hypothetical protein
MTSQAPPPPPLPKPSQAQIAEVERLNKQNLTKAFDAVRGLNTGSLQSLLSDRRVAEWLEMPADEGIASKVNSQVTAGTNMGSKSQGIRSRYTLEEGQTLSDYLTKRGVADDTAHGDNPNYATHIALRGAYDDTVTKLGKEGKDIKTHGASKDLQNPMGDLFKTPGSVGEGVSDDDASRNSSDSGTPPRTLSPAINVVGASPEVLAKAMQAGNVEATLVSGGAASVKQSSPGKPRFIITPVGNVKK